MYTMAGRAHWPPVGRAYRPLGLPFRTCSPLKTALFPHFSYKVLGVLPRLVWSQRSCSASLFSQLWEYLRASRKWESINLGLSGSVGIKGHAVAEAVAEASKGVARALLYIVRASPSFLIYPSFKTFYYTFYQVSPGAALERIAWDVALTVLRVSLLQVQPPMTLKR